MAVLAGGTGSGKSSLFNQMAGADFSAVGVTRPFTKDPHACVWGVDGAGPLLEWLGIPHRNRYARSSALSEGESSLGGLILIDLPDHDSVAAGAAEETNRLVGLADLMLWVLDPQKYADASVHRRYLTPLAGHSSVIAVVLNQSDLLSPEQAEDCVSDLTRLLDTEGLHDARVLVTSARTGAGLDELRKVLTETVAQQRAATDRIAADLDAMAERFMLYAGEARGAGLDTGTEDFAEVPPGSAVVLGESFSKAAGAAGVGQALQSARELRAVDYVGWPVSWLVDRALGHDPVRKLRLGNLWEELRGISGGPAGRSRRRSTTRSPPSASRSAPRSRCPGRTRSGWPRGRSGMRSRARWARRSASRCPRRTAWSPGGGWWRPGRACCWAASWPGWRGWSRCW